MTLVLTPLHHIPLIQSGDSVANILLEVLPSNQITVEDGDIIVIAQKIISKAEGRLVNLTTVSPSTEAVRLAGEVDKDPRFVELVLQESREVLRKRPGTIIVEHRQGFVCANAGIDHSNVEGHWGAADDWVLLLPEDADRSAREVQARIEQATHKKVGVLIIDSHGRAWRNGTIGMSIGVAGVPGLVDLRGVSDLFGFQLRITTVGVADELAAAASLMMGQAAEKIPAVHVRGFPYPLRDSSVQELIRPKELDMFR